MSEIKLPISEDGKRLVAIFKAEIEAAKQEIIAEIKKNEEAIVEEDKNEETIAEVKNAAPKTPRKG
ncbi:hypothetical protein [Cytobacillus oceanisediminis]|uniref:hypothetical protein n=1 Tax=Cytobacillus oceanisediminis TaxID=665099 RepID=UPI001C2347E9|nr:hypothetical protein [Cytobacillus oceanisediminis]MBU8770330.1 hypothetical protein [Cytobacillus oceanisediminis]